MSNTSATGGYLSPDPAEPVLEGSELEDFFQTVIVGISGVASTLVRPRWQPEPGNLPDADQTWLAFGITTITPDTYAVELHEPDGEGTDEIWRNELIELMLSGYGPQASTAIARFRDGLQVSQNREALQAEKMNLVDTGEPITAPTLVKDRWLNRIDMRVTFTRVIRRVYSVENIESSNVTIDNEQYLTQLRVLPH